MSQSSSAGLEALQAQINELMAEIAFQQVLLSSIDDTVPDRKEAEDDVKAEIRSLERQIRDLRRSFAPSTSKRLSTSERSQNLQMPSRQSTAFHQAMDTGSLGLETVEGSETPACSMSSTGSTPTSSGPMAADKLPTGQSGIPNRKRSHSSHLGAGLSIGQNKSRRTSPSPCRTRPETPASGSSDDEVFEADFQEEYRKRQLAEECKIRRIKEDEELARSLQNEPLIASSTSVGGNSTPSALDRISGVRPAPSSSKAGMSTTPQFGRPSNPGGTARAWSPSLPQSGSSSIRAHHKTPFSIKQESTPIFGSMRQGGSSSVDHGLTYLPHVPGAYRDEWYISSDSEAESFGSSTRKIAGKTDSSDRARTVFSPPSKSAGDAALRRLQRPSDVSTMNQRAKVEAFGKYALPAWMNNGTDSPAPGASKSPSVGVASPYSVGGILGGIKRESGLGGGVPVYIDGYGNSINVPASSSSPNGFPTSVQDPYGLPAHILNSFNARMANELDYVVNDPRKTAQEIKDLLENIRPDVEMPPEDREGTPEGLKYPLYEHQKLALTWVKSQEEGTNKGGILADDMGLGKTITSLALLLSRPSDDRARKTTLIVGPVALIRQWEREIRMKIKSGARLSTHMVHGQGRKLPWDELRNFDIVLTTYGTLGAEYRRLVKHYESFNGRDVDEAPMRKLFPLLGPKSLFYRIILDEAQCIKNKSTQAALAACRLRSTYRWCLTGTPMMNNVGELFSLIRFLQIRPYNDWTRFQSSFSILTKGERYKGQIENAMKKLQAVLKAILLRRTKSSLIDGKPIITLPPKTEEIQHVVFNEDEQEFYTSLETKTRIAFNKYVRAGTVGKNYSNILVLLLRLRQCCCHPHLIMDFDQASPDGVLAQEGMVALAKSLAPEVVARILEAEGFECPVCYDAAENPSILVPCGHDTCAECLSKISDQAVQQNVANGEGDAGNTAKCPTCRGKLELKNVIDYATFKKVHVKGSAEGGEEVDDEDSDSDTASDSETDSESGEDSDDDLGGFVVPDGVIDDDEGSAADDKVDEPAKEAKVTSKSMSKLKSNKSKREKRRQQAKSGKKKEAPMHLSIAMLKKEASRNAEGRRRYMRYLRKNWQPSAKIDKCVELLERFQEEDQKTIVFSQFVSLLDLLEVPINSREWNCERYDGSMSADARNDAIVRFTDNPNCKIMLISLKAGNAGLNLVAASRVIILDPFWNPYIEMQAVDRAYRIGQQRPVEVHRILIQKTVEDRIIELQEKKRALVDAALDEGASRSLGRLDERQLAFLFGVGDP